MLNPEELDVFQTLAADTIAIGQLVGNNNNPGIDAYRHQLHIIASEFEELEDGWNTVNRQELRVGLADTLFTVVGLYGRMNWSLPVYLPEPCHGDDSETLITWLSRQINALKVIGSITCDSVFIVARHIADQILTNCIVLGRRLNIDVEADWGAVNASNWTKFDRDDVSAIETFKKYESKGIAIYQTTVGNEQGETHYITFSAKEQQDEKGRRMPAHKWLKSVNFVDVDFSE